MDLTQNADCSGPHSLVLVKLKNRYFTCIFLPAVVDDQLEPSVGIDHAIAGGSLEG